MFSSPVLVNFNKYKRWGNLTNTLIVVLNLKIDLPFSPEPVSLLISILLEEAAAHVKYKKARLPWE